MYTRRSRCPPFLLFPTNILSNKVKQVCYKIIFINSLFIIYYNFLKIFNTVENLKKRCGHHALLYRRIAKVGRKVRVKASTFLTGLPLWPIKKTSSYNQPKRTRQYIQAALTHLSGQYKLFIWDIIKGSFLRFEFGANPILVWQCCLNVFVLLYPFFLVGTVCFLKTVLPVRGKDR